MKKLLNIDDQADDDFRRRMLRFCMTLSAKVDYLDAELGAYRQRALELPERTLDSPDRFYYALSRGEIIGVPRCPALSGDVYQCYRIWCACNGLHAIRQPYFINALKQRHKLATIKRRYLDETRRIKGPCAVLVLGGVSEPPAGLGNQEWLGEHIRRFRAALKDLRGATP